MRTYPRDFPEVLAAKHGKTKPSRRCRGIEKPQTAERNLPPPSAALPGVGRVGYQESVKEKKDGAGKATNVERRLWRALLCHELELD